MTERMRASYILETALDPQTAAEALAGEQSSGTFVALPGETPELKARAGARIERLEPLETVAEPSLPGAAPAKPGESYHRVALELSWPLGNLGPSLPNLVATVTGNLFELHQVAGLRIQDIDLPDAFADAYVGPQFGVDGTRRLSGVHGRPLIGTIVKPSVGLDPSATAQLVNTLVENGQRAAANPKRLGTLFDFIQDTARIGACHFIVFIRIVCECGRNLTSNRRLVGGLNIQRHHFRVEVTRHSQGRFYRFGRQFTSAGGHEDFSVHRSVLRVLIRTNGRSI